MVGADELGGLTTALEEEVGSQTEVVAKVGASTSWGIDQLTGRPSVPSVVVVALGSNPGPAVESFAADVEALVEALIDRGAERIVWVPPVGLGASWDYADKAQVLRDSATTYSELEVMEWDRDVREHPERITGDGLHPTPDGYRCLVAAIEGAVARDGGDRAC
jgi:lysophospholipase L1-like esterase